MASKNSKLIFVLLLSVAVAAVGGCEPGQGVVPKDPLPGCRAYLLRRCAGGDPPGVRARCCHQLREVAPRCRCDALRAMVEVLVEEEEAPPTCKKGAMAAIAEGLLGRDECDLETRATAGEGDDGGSRRCHLVINWSAAVNK
uniref:Bifunctional inhibitor/plant lipid transfer protein/seed storage helical domain-containing protein n=1 Tax=Oryza punctata TaxID=4537 RepID=A0A0E0LII2_ORYPU